MSMQDIAEEVVQQLCAKDGDLDVCVNCKCWARTYKIQPTIRKGKLSWVWHAKEYTIEFENVDEVMCFLEDEQRIRERNAQGCLEIWSKDKNGTELKKFLFKRNIGVEGTGEKEKRFLEMCGKIQMRKKVDED